MTEESIMNISIYQNSTIKYNIKNNILWSFLMSDMTSCCLEESDKQMICA